MTAPAKLARDARALVAECLRHLGPLPAVKSTEAWDARILAALRADGAPVAARRAWRHATEIWWRLALTNTRRIINAEAYRHLAAGSGRYMLEDLKQAARIGVYRAAQGWRPQAGASWGTFAGNGARMGIRVHLRQGATELLYIPTNTRLRQWSMQRWQRHLEQEGLELDADGLAEVTGIPLRMVEELLATRRITYLDQPEVRRGGGGRRAHVGDFEDDRHELIGASEQEDIEDVLDRQREIERVRAAMAQLPERLQLVLRRRLDDWTLAQIGEEIGVSRERVRQLEIRALQELGRLLGATQAQRRGLWRRPETVVVNAMQRAGRPVDWRELVALTGLEAGKVRAVLARVGHRVGACVYVLAAPYAEAVEPAPSAILDAPQIATGAAP